MTCVLGPSVALAAEAPPLLRNGEPQPSDVRLVDAGHAIDVYADAADHAVVGIAAGLLAKDVAAVTGATPTIVHDVVALRGQAVIVGTIGHSAAVDRLIANGRLDVSGVRGKWETFLIATVVRPLPEIDRALVVVGSDRRGTAFGALELSEQIGVSPWNWWADVTPSHRDALTIVAGAHVVGPPTVKYRGIFINDEDWGFTPWASKTVEPARGNVGPKTYARVFELLLRLKANYLWPAMHPASTEFGTIPENVRLADDWAIVMGASHAEPMNRDNVFWNRENRGPWNYVTNRDGVYKYWEEWASRRGKYEAVWSVGMRGIHDSGMNGPKDAPGQAKLLGEAIDDQRKLLAQYVDPHVERVPQVFTPYKEALSQYQADLKLADDVTLVWPDDNYGHIRQLSTPAEQARAGHSGVYYHVSYLGRPKPYLWIETTPPALIWTEMRKALAFGADRAWVVNVGDIKPAEIGIEFWTKLAWNGDRYGVDAQSAYLKEFATREFGADRAYEIVGVLNDYYHLAFQRKPELMERRAFRDDEAADRLAAYDALLARAEAIATTLPSDRRDAYFELVLYPVRVAALTNRAFLADDRETRAASVERLKRETAYFNDDLAGGKWRGMMTLTGFARTGEYAKWADDWFMQWPTTEPTAVSARHATTRPTGTGDFVERDGVVSIYAEHFSRSRAADGGEWTAIPGLGRSGDAAVTVLPANVPSVEDVMHAPSLDYDFTTTAADVDATLQVACLPTYRIHPGRGLRYAVAIDDSASQVVELNTDLGPTGEAAAQLENIRRNVSLSTSRHHVGVAGAHVLHLWMVDPGVVVDRFALDLGGLKTSELGPPETRARRVDRRRLTITLLGPQFCGSALPRA